MLLKTPNGRAQIEQVFGDANSPNFEAEHIVSFELPYPLKYDSNPVHKARCHKLLVENFQAAFKELLDKGLSQHVQNYSGIYARRPIRGKRNPSTHSWGIAIDLEAGKYPLGSTARFPQEVVDVFKKHGFTYGGDFKSRKDPMHFQFASGY